MCPSPLAAPSDEKATWPLHVFSSLRLPLCHGDAGTGRPSRNHPPSSASAPEVVPIFSTGTGRLDTRLPCNAASALGHFLRDNGEIGTVNANQSLAANLGQAFYRDYTDRLPLAPDVATLPGMKGSGAVRDLHEAAMQNPELRERLAA